MLDTPSILTKSAPSSSSILRPPLGCGEDCFTQKTFSLQGKYGHGAYVTLDSVLARAEDIVPSNH